MGAFAEGRGRPARPVSHQHRRISSRCGVRSLILSRLAKAKKRQNIYKCMQKCGISIAPKDTKPEFKGTNPALKKPSNIPEIYAKMFGRFH